MTPLKQARIKRGWTLTEVSARLVSLGADRVDTGNLSRIERGNQRASATLAESLTKVFEGDITEIHVLYPERFTSESGDSTAAA
ncbi:helix-turn-helix transcriptional regulator [Pseudomonas alliivorans]|nr:helix-turn-helix transcriptional regulator [Pseudomonas alliivorans]MEE5079539.1 helix-turn-helix transcriptional regulator [Pseudomonas alliivorans]